MRQLVVRKAPPSEIRAAATRTGVEPLRTVAVKKLLSGVTSIDEVIRVTVAEESAGG
jgi:type II secretory ATPase GspE/PulE/Tfp pilus assembly ATPase PilB-like protein